MLVWTFAVKSIKDTQCGFKLLSRSAARRIFEIMHVERWFVGKFTKIFI